jgi:hypothetical protein
MLVTGKKNTGGTESSHCTVCSTLGLLEISIMKMVFKTQAETSRE